jgi:hypothetical protein
MWVGYSGETPKAHGTTLSLLLLLLLVVVLGFGWAMAEV